MQLGLCLTGGESSGIVLVETHTPEVAMRNDRKVKSSFLCVFLAAACAAAVPALEPVLADREFLPLQGQVLPRYRFEVGQELCYSARGTLADDSVFGTLERTSRYTVINEDPDGVCRLLIHIVESERRLDAPHNPPARTWLAYADITPAGRYELNPLLRPVDRAAFFTPLPEGPAEAAAGWTKPDPRGMENMAFAIAGVDSLDDHLLAIRQAASGLRARAYGSEYAATILFDTALGLITHKELVMREGYYVPGRWVMEATLDSVRYLEADELDNLAAAAATWFDAWTEWDSLTDLAETDRDRAEALLDAADSTLARALGALTRPELGEDARRFALGAHAESELARWRRLRDYYASAEKERPGLEGGPAPEWELADLDGSIHRLADYRGRVVVLDFWYRLCSWCIQGLPELARLQERYRGRPVAVLGVNVDEDPDDPRHIAREFGLSFPTLFSQETEKDYGVTGFPTTVIIGPDGVVAEVHRGLHPDMVERLAATIDRLLETEGGGQ